MNIIISICNAGSNGNWCQFFTNDKKKPGWPIPDAVNDSQSVVTSGTIPGNGCSKVGNRQ